jgi:hypothetical protein
MPTHPGREFIGSEDFMSLFEPEAPWHTAASRVQVFKLYGEWVAYHATHDELRQAVTDIRRRGMALAVEAGPLDAPGDCGQGIEGFAGKEEGLRIASRIAAAGGTLNLIAMDEPYFYGHVYDGENACRWPVEKVAAEVDVFIKAMQEAIPGVIIGDTEPLTGAADAQPIWRGSRASVSSTATTWPSCTWMWIGLAPRGRRRSRALPSTEQRSACRWA